MSTRKLQEAIELCKKPITREEGEKYVENVSKAIKIFNALCFNKTLPSGDKYNALIKYIELIPDQGIDMLTRYRDSIPFLHGKILDGIIDILVKVIETPNLISHERIITTVMLYNRGFIDICYPCFVTLANDATMNPEHRVDACRYLFGSEEEEYLESSQEALIDITNNQDFTSEKRYEWIASFISNTGIATSFNASKLRVAYDERFVYGIQTSFFFNSENGIRERILSGQHLLQMSCCEEKESVVDELMKIASNPDVEYNTRADAADVVLRLAKGEQKKRARDLIVKLGFRAVETGQTGNVTDRNRTIYTDEQNVHSTHEYFDNLIEKVIINNTDVELPEYEEVRQEVTALVKQKINDNRKWAAYKSLTRINLDSATFTQYNVTIAEILVHVWVQVRTHRNPQNRELMENMLIEELVEMAGTCSSGHSTRLVNVLAIVDDGMKISWTDQITANISARITAAIRDCPDEDLRSAISVGMLKDSDQEDRDIYLKFVNEELVKIKEELRKEFVEASYTTNEIFEESFDIGKQRWL